ncbi:MAG: hypothetical protein K8E24_000865 [Methanobacterium paludis]|nr:hypothetical protein [Methanobacterium paludis]
MSDKSDKGSGDIGEGNSSMDDKEKNDRNNDKTKDSSFNSFLSDIKGFLEQLKEFLERDLTHHGHHENTEKNHVDETSKTSKTEPQKPGVSEGGQKSPKSEISEGGHESPKSEVSEGGHESPKSGISEDPKSSEDSNGQDHEFPIVEHLMKYESFRTLKSKKAPITQFIALFVGIILIVYGLILMSSSAIKVADNVMFSETAMFAAFLMLVGVLIIAAAFAQKLLSATFLKNIHSELEVAEGRKDPVDTSKENSKNTADENDNKVDKNKNNITGEC